MHFLQIHLSLPRGGAHIAIQNIKKGLEKLGHRCVIEKNYPDSKMVGGGYDLVLFHSFSESNREMYLKCLDLARDYSIPHAIVMHDYWAFCHQTNLIMPKMGLKKCEVSPDHPCDPKNRCGFDGPPHSLLKDEIADRHIVCFNDRSAALFDNAGFSNIHTIPHGVDVLTFRPRDYDRRPAFRVLFTNAWGAKDIKGYRHWKWLQNQFATDDDIILESTLGDTPHRLMPNFLMKGDAMLFLSLWDETFGLVVVESMACGTPVISYPVGVAPDAIRDGDNGFLIDTNNPRDVEAKIRQMASMPTKQLTSMRKQARDSIVKQYSLDDMAQGYIDLARSIT